MRIKIMFIVSFLYQSVFSQNTSLCVKIYQDEKLLNEKIEFFITINNNKSKLECIDSFLIIPDTLFRKTVDFTVITNKYQLVFQDLVISWNKDYLFWNIEIDFPPFDKDKHWSIKDKLKRMKWIYTIDRGNGTTIKYFGRKPLKK